MKSEQNWIRRAAFGAGSLALGMAMLCPPELLAQPAGGRGGDQPAMQEGRGAPGGARGQGRGGGGMGRGAPAAAPEVGFRQLFDGRSLNGWRGEDVFWRVEGGVIVGQSTEENPVVHNGFLIWEGGEPADFEIKLEFRFTGDSGNSGLQYRSAMRTDYEDGFEWGLQGYQADMDFNNNFTGMLYQEGPGSRGFLAPRGYFTVIEPASGEEEQARPMMLGALGDAAEIATVIHPPGEWNELHVIAIGNRLTHMVNGRVTAMLIDNDPAGRAFEGLIGLQIHGGPPMRVEFRNIRIKEY